MPQLPRRKHPEIAARNALILAAFWDGKVMRKIAAEFNLSRIRVAQIITEYSGWKRSRPFVRYTTRHRKRFVELWNSGTTYAGIRTELGLDRSTVRRWRIELKLKPRGRGKRPLTPPADCGR